MTRYRAITINEPNGEGGGWDDCSPDAEGALWAVEDTDETQPWIVDVYPNRAAAEAGAATMNEGTDQ